VNVKLTITDERPVASAYTSYGNTKVETYTVAEVDGALTRAATVGFLRALADSIEGDHA
jgi:hypothetical protein